MDIIKLFYQRVRVKQILHFFIKAQAKEFECIPFIEGNSLVQNSYQHTIYREAEKTLTHILNDMCLPYKKRQFETHDDVKVEHLLKYSAYLYLKRKRIKLNNKENKTLEKPENVSLGISAHDASTLNMEIGLSEQNEPFSQTITPENIFEDVGTSQNTDNKRSYIESQLKSVIKDESWEVDTTKSELENQLLEQSKKDLKVLITSAINKTDMPDTWHGNVINTIEDYYHKFKTDKLNTKNFKEVFTDEFLKEYENV